MLTLIWRPSHPRVIAVARKRPRSLHAPLTQRSRSGPAKPLSRHSVETYQENELTRNLSGNIRPQSSQPAEPLWTDPGIKSGICVRELISTFKKNRRQGMNGRTFSWNPRKRGNGNDGELLVSYPNRGLNIDRGTRNLSDITSRALASCQAQAMCDLMPRKRG